MGDFFDDEEPTIREEITARHDGGEWFKGFASGVLAGRVDVLGLVYSQLGHTDIARELVTRILGILNATEKPSPNRG